MYAIAAGHPLTARTAADVLEDGGNAYDAAAAAAFVQPLAEPVLASLGGGGLLIAREPDARTTFYDFFAAMPGRGGAPGAAGETVEVRVDYGGAVGVYHAGAASVAVPGLLRGLLELHAARGRLPLARLVAPAAHAARTGVPLSPLQAYLFTLIEPILTLTPESRALFAPRGRPLTAGEPLQNPDYAAFLERLPNEGAAAFYTGVTAERLVAYLRERGGCLTVDDLAGFQTLEAPARVFERSPAALRFSPGPSLGGAAVAELLAAYLEEPHRHENEPRHYLGLAQAMQHVAKQRGHQRGTTHLSLRDAEGRLLAMTVTNGEGSGLVAPGTGIFLNNILGEDDVVPPEQPRPQPGERLVSMMAPVLLETGGDVYALGSGGSRRIRTAVFQTAAHLLTGFTGLESAVNAPRVHYENETLEVEPGLNKATRRALGREFHLNLWGRKDFYFGGVHAVSLSGSFAGDPRREGSGIATVQ